MGLAFQNNIPLSSYLENGKIKLLNAKDTQYYFQLAAATVNNLDPKNKDHKEMLKKWTSRSLRVGPTVLLFEKGFSPLQLQFLLRWNYEAYRSYLRNLPQLAQQQHYVLNDSNTTPNLNLLI